MWRSVGSRAFTASMTSCGFVTPGSTGARPPSSDAPASPKAPASTEAPASTDAPASAEEPASPPPGVVPHDNTNTLVTRRTEALNIRAGYQTNSATLTRPRLIPARAAVESIRQVEPQVVMPAVHSAPSAAAGDPRDTTSFPVSSAGGVTSTTTFPATRPVRLRSHAAPSCSNGKRLSMTTSS
jgi:hypothetical protein